MAILAPTTSKKFYTRANDEMIISMLAEGKKTEEIAEAVGHSASSLQYRISRVLRSNKYESLDDIKYPGDKKVETETEEA